MEDLKGRRFNSLLVEDFYGYGSNYKTLWNCLCDCGNRKIILGSSLKNGNTKTCGHIIDLSGSTFGRLKVIRYYDKKKSGGDSRWLCQCECGKEKIVCGSNLKSGHTKSCGCYRNEMTSNKNTAKFVEGTVFGKLTVVKYLGSKNNSGVWLCKCECGNHKKVISYHLTSGSVSSCGCLRESLIASQLKKYCEEKLGGILEYRIVKNPKTNRFLPYDIYIPNKNIYIEVNGKQHYTPNGGWGMDSSLFEHNKKLDLIKKKFARKNGIYVEIDLRKIKNTEDAISIVNKVFSSKGGLFDEKQSLFDKIS